MAFASELSHKSISVNRAYKDQSVKAVKKISENELNEKNGFNQYASRVANIKKYREDLLRAQRKFNPIMSSTAYKVGIDGIVENRYKLCCDVGRENISLEETIRNSDFEQSDFSEEGGDIADIEMTEDSHKPQIPCDKVYAPNSKVHRDMLIKMMNQRVVQMILDHKAAEKESSMEEREISKLEHQYHEKHCAATKEKCTPHDKTRDFIIEVSVVANDMSEYSNQENRSLYLLGRKSVDFKSKNFDTKGDSMIEIDTINPVFEQASFVREVVEKFTESKACEYEEISQPFIHISVKRVPGISEHIMKECLDQKQDEEFKLRKMSEIKQNSDDVYNNDSGAMYYVQVE